MEKKIYNPEQPKISYEKIPSMRKTNSQKIRLSSTKNLVNLCNDEVKTEKYKTINPKVNFFQDLQKKVYTKDKEGE